MFTGIGGFELGIERAIQDVRFIQQEDTGHTPLSDRTTLQHDKGNGWQCIGFSEIDKYAIATFESHFPNIKNYGDATKINTDELPDFDMLCGGFPCQSFSIAGKRKGFQDTRGTLFHEILRIAKAKRPRLLFFENVKGLLSADDGRCFATIISLLDELGYSVEWQVLNSKHFGVPQNRERVFIIGHLRGTSFRQVFPIGKSSEGNLTYYAGIISQREKWIEGDKNLSREFSQGQRIYNVEGISQTLAGNAGGQGGKTGLYAIPVLTPNRPEKRQNGRRFKEDGEDMFTLTGQDIHGVMQETKIRRLTPTECERLQGFPDKWTIGSDTQRYKQCGNAVTVNVIESIARQLNDGGNFTSAEVVE